MYKKPICDCGRELLVSTMQTYLERFKITKKGKKEENPFQSILLGTSKHELPEGVLFCESCGSEYRNVIKHGKSFRGEPLE